MNTRADRSPLRAEPLRVPGQSVRNQKIDLLFERLIPLLWITTIAAALTIAAVVQEWTGWRPTTFEYALVTGALVAVSALRLYFLRPKLEAFDLGQRGEVAVGQYLEQYLIPEGARVIHDVLGDRFNLDHVVIAPQGVFVIETKTYSKPRHGEARITFAEDGTLRVAGHRPDRDPIVQVQAGSRWLSELLTELTGEPVQCREAVVFPGWSIEYMSREWLNAGRPWVLQPKAFAAFLAQEQALLTLRQVKMYAGHLSRYMRARQEAERKR
ncbi:MAG: NERD domain-containing protein [Proteobacteria bacterium]|nr:NERD domain-containing protein [Pseudomonadota bacterium]